MQLDPRHVTIIGRDKSALLSNPYENLIDNGI